jgi:hypothetical protein
MNTNRLLAYQERKVDSTKVWLLYLFFGWSYGSLGKGFLQFLFYITLGGLGLWALIRLLTLNGSIKSYNKTIAQKVGMTPNEMKEIGLIN